MKHLLVTSLALSLSAPLLAQTASSPDGLLTTEGRTFSRYFGVYADGRQQFANGDFEGKAIKISQVAYRLDNRSHSLNTTAGRSWTKVDLMVSECATSPAAVKLTSTWSTNSITTPVMAFSGKIAWPTQVGYPSASSSVPAAWGGRGGKLRFPFKAPWSYSGKGGMLLDYSFSGGALDNGESWDGSSYVSYYMDGTAVSSFASGARTYFPSSTTCNDSAHTHTFGAYTSVSATAYGLNSPTTPGKVVVSFFSAYTAPTANVVIAMTGGGSATGVDAGTACNKLHVDLTKTIGLQVQKAGSGSGFYFSPSYPLNFSATLAGQELWGQAAWTDSKTNRLSLTRTRRAVVPKALPAVVKRAMVYHSDSGLAAGNEPVDAFQSNFHPVMQVTYK